MTDAKIVDRSDKCEFSIDKDQTGEICLKNKAVAIGYVDGVWGKVKSIVDAEGYYATGDLGKVHKDGSVSFISRVGLVVKL